MNQISRSAVQGPELLSFVATTLNDLDEEVYYYVNSIIVIYGLTAMQKRGTKWVYLKDEKGQNLVPKECFEIVPKSFPGIEKENIPAAFKYRGGLQPTLVFPEMNGTFKCALDSVARLREVQGSDNSCSSLLASMKGWSGMTNEFGRRVTFLVSSVLGCWRLGRAATVQLTTIGDLPILVSSLNAWKKVLDNPKEESFKSMKATEILHKAQEFKFLLPGIAHYNNVPKSLQTFVVHTPIPGSIVIMFHPSNLPTSDLKGVPVDYDGKSEMIMPVVYPENDVILYTIIFGDSPFAHDKEVIKRRSRSTNAIKPWQWYPPTKGEPKKEKTAKDRPIYIYQFGTSSGFRGILSTVELSLIGFGHPPIHQDGKLMGHDFTSQTIHTIDLVEVPSQEKWYNMVSMDCRRQAVSWITPLVRYSGISNLLTQSKNAAALNSSMVESEDGFIPTLTTRRGNYQAEEEVDFSVPTPQSILGVHSSGYVPSNTSSSSSTSSTTSSILAKLSVQPIAPSVPATVPDNTAAASLMAAAANNDDDVFAANVHDDDEEVPTTTPDSQAKVADE
jgi:hypothetical protein